jgi:MoaA/NifB/PqqE/SkfB family radical SAM enzyme
MQTNAYRNVFDNNIAQQFKKAVQIMAKDPSKLLFFMKMLKNQEKAARLRKKHLKEGLEVPPLLIISITSVCNLSCVGCYSKHLHRDVKQEMSAQRFREIVTEAKLLGVSIILLAGGEPLVQKDMLKAATEFPEIMFPIFTNGLLVDEEYITFFKKNPNLIPVISLEGKEDETNERRGDGVYQNFRTIKDSLNENRILWGTSLTLTSGNFELLTSPAYIKVLMDNGCRLFFYVEYVPIEKECNEMIISETQKKKVQPIVDQFMKEQPAMFVAFPGDEDQYDGCLAAGRGFLHINPEGKVEPCPFAPFSDQDLRNTSLKEALSSHLLAAIRKDHKLLKEKEGGCALWANREWLNQLTGNRKQIQSRNKVDPPAPLIKGGY